MKKRINPDIERWDHSKACIFNQRQELSITLSLVQPAQISASPLAAYSLEKSGSWGMEDLSL